MRIGHVIGRVTMNHYDPALKGGRWLVVHPVDAEDLDTACEKRPRLLPGYGPIVYDNLGAGDGDIIGYVEGAEATAPFDRPIPIDAICVAIFDQLSYQEVPSGESAKSQGPSAK